jgi:multiple sugar transport system permease protein
MLMPFQVTMVPNYLVMDRLGLMDTLYAVILPFAFAAFPVFIMMKGFDSVPKALLDAAAIDGAGHFRTFLSVDLPLGVPGILAALVFLFGQKYLELGIQAAGIKE